jgi:hypothetical protein
VARTVRGWLGGDPALAARQELWRMVAAATATPGPTDQAYAQDPIAIHAVTPSAGGGRIGMSGRAGSACYASEYEPNEAAKPLLSLSPSRLRSIAQKYAQAAGISPLVMLVRASESFDRGRSRRSGLTQVLPETARVSTRRLGAIDNEDSWHAELNLQPVRMEQPWTRGDLPCSRLTTQGRAAKRARRGRRRRRRFPGGDQPGIAPVRGRRRTTRSPVPYGGEATLNRRKR